jgi:hypothetical protein
MGNFVAVGDYDVPVPDRWLVLSQDAYSVLIVDTAGLRRDGGNLTTNGSLSISSLPEPPRDLKYWVSNQIEGLTGSDVRIIEQRTLAVANEAVYCIGGSELRDVVHIPDNAIISLQCRSTGKLSLVFTGETSDAPGFYALVERIRKGRN